MIQKISMQYTGHVYLSGLGVKPAGVVGDIVSPYTSEKPPNFPLDLIKEEVCDRVGGRGGELSMSRCESPSV
jgi:hypothetical protein